MKRLVVVLGVAGLLAGMGLAMWADGEVRPTTQAEKDYVLRVSRTFEASAPKGPAGWEMVERTEVKAPRNTGINAENFGPMTVGYHVAWQDSGRIDAAKARLDGKLAGLARETMNNHSADEGQARQDKLIAELTAALNRGDMAKAKALQAKLEKLGQQMKAAYEPQNRKLDKTIEANDPHDVRASVGFNCNEFDVSFVSGEVTREPSLAGAKVVRYHSEGRDNYGWQEGITYVFLGNWSMGESGGVKAMVAAPAPKKPHTVVRTIVVSVKAEPRRARRLLEAVDWARLKTLLNR